MSVLSTEPEMKVTALAPWFGSNRMLASAVGEQLDGCTWVGVVFAGGMSEVRHIGARTIVVNDLHRHVINLARCVADDALRGSLVAALDAVPFHPDVLQDAQRRCRAYILGDSPHLPAAVDYFVTQWMARSGKAGTRQEFSGGIPVRWTAAGGDSNTRFRSAAESLRAWGQVMRRCNFTVLDAFEFLKKCKDEAECGLYSDPPWPDLGDAYQHAVGESFHRRLATVLAGFRNTRVVVRYGDHPLIRGLYPTPQWRWIELQGRTQSNADSAEVLIVSNPQKGGVQ